MLTRKARRRAFGVLPAVFAIWKTKMRTVEKAAANVIKIGGFCKKIANEADLPRCQNKSGAWG